MCGQEAFNLGTHCDGMQEAKVEMNNDRDCQDHSGRDGGRKKIECQVHHYPLLPYFHGGGGTILSVVIIITVVVSVSMEVLMVR